MYNLGIMVSLYLSVLYKRLYFITSLAMLHSQKIQGFALERTWQKNIYSYVSSKGLSGGSLEIIYIFLHSVNDWDYSYFS